MLKFKPYEERKLHACDAHRKVTDARMKEQVAHLDDHQWLRDPLGSNCPHTHAVRS